MSKDILPDVIFAPAELALSLANGLRLLNVDVTLFTPGPVDTKVANVISDRSYFEKELQARGDSYLELLKKHPFTFITLARQLQSELIADAIKRANDGQFDIVHVYTNEEDTALPMAALSTVPVVFTHHDPFNFLVKYRSVFAKYTHLNWISISDAQRKSMPHDTNWLATIHHGIDGKKFTPNVKPTNNKRPYVAYFGRIIEPKGVHLAIKAVQLYNQSHDRKMILKIAGKHYSDMKKDKYWNEKIYPHIDGEFVQYVGYIKDQSDKEAFLQNASSLIVPSLFDEPFGMVMIEAMACGTPIIGLDSGAIPEIISHKKTGFVIKKIKIQIGSEVVIDEIETAKSIVSAIERIDTINRSICRAEFLRRFTAEKMCRHHKDVYRRLLQDN